MTESQLNKLSEEELSEYQGMSNEEKKQFEYFMGFTTHTVETAVVTNKEIALYQEMTDKITLKSVAQLLDFIPHEGQKPIFYTVDECKDVINNIVMVLGRRSGKSASSSIIAMRELLVPFSATILLTPTFNNAKVIFNEVVKHVQSLGLSVKSMNRGSFRFELENGARFSANSASNIESALGTANSLLIMDESQSIPGLMEIVAQMLAPTLLDYGSRPSGILYGRQVYLGTSRGTENQLYDLYIKEEELPNWKSFNAPSYLNPILPQSYFEQMRKELGEMLYRQEILAEFIGQDDNVFYAFGEHNLYAPGTKVFSKDTDYIVGIDIGFRDSTAGVFLYRDSRGYYYLDKAYSMSQKATSYHVNELKALDDAMVGTLDLRYMDPAAAQSICDYTQDYDYLVNSANNDVQGSIKYINQLLTPTGANVEPKLYVNSELTEVIRQLKRVRWKDKTSKTSKDPFNSDNKGTHWDLIAAIRYAIFSDQHNLSAGNIIVS